MSGFRDILEEIRTRSRRQLHECGGRTCRGRWKARSREALERVPHFCVSETPFYVGRAVAALAADPEVARWMGASLSSGALARPYGFTDLDGSRPDAWRCLVEVQDPGKPADATGYR